MNRDDMTDLGFAQDYLSQIFAALAKSEEGWPPYAGLAGDLAWGLGRHLNHSLPPSAIEALMAGLRLKGNPNGRIPQLVRTIDTESETDL